MKSALKNIALDALIGLLLSLCALGGAVLLVLNAGQIASLVGADEKIVSVLSQLRQARIVPQWLALIPATGMMQLFTLPRHVRKRWVKVLLFLLAVLSWLALLILLLLGLSVNGVSVHAALRILIHLLKGGVLNAL